MNTSLGRGKGCRRVSALAGLVMGISLLLLPASLAGQTLVQQANNPGSTSVAFTNPQSVGDLNVVVIGWSNVTSSVTSVTDTAGNAYAPALGVNNEVNVSQTIFYAKNIAASGCSPACNTITVAFNQTPATPDIRVYEFSGIDTVSPLDTSSGGNGSSGSANSSNANTNNAGDLLIGGGTTSSQFTAKGSGYTQLGITAFGDLDEYEVAGAAGSYGATATLAAGTWVMQMAAFRATGQGAPAFAAPTLTSITPNNGADTGGTGVTLTGTGFQPGAMVFVGTAPGGVLAANCAVASGTTLNCNMPADNPGPKDITVQNVDGKNASLVAAFTYNTVTPGISSITPSSGVTNGNTPITISGDSFQTGAKVIIGGEPVSNLNVVNSTTITCNTPAGNVGAADVVVTNPDGGSTTATGGYTYAIGNGPVNFVQRAEKSFSTQSQSSVNVPLANPSTAGDLEVVIIGWGDTSSAVSGVTDDAGNTYAQAIAITANTGNSLSQTIWYAKNIKSNTSVTVTFNRSAATPDIRILEYRGLDPASPLDTNPASANFKTGTGTVADSGQVTTTFTNNLIIAAAMVGNAVTGAGNGFTTVLISANGNNAEHQINGGAVTGIDPSATLLNSPWLMQAVTFHAPINVAPPGFTLGAATPSPVNPGSSASSTITVTPQDGFSAAVALSCSAPSSAGIGCSITPKSVTPGGAPVQATMTITTTGPTAALMAPRNGHSLLPLYAIWLPLPGIALAGIGVGSRRRKLGMGMVLFLVFAFTLLLFGCGGGGSSSGGGGGGGGTGGTAAGSYTITVNASSPGVNTKTTTVTLTVQ